MEPWQCPICNETMKLEYASPHWAKHMQLGDQIPADDGLSRNGRALVFWFYCLLVGAVGGAVFAILH